MLLGLQSIETLLHCQEYLQFDMLIQIDRYLHLQPIDKNL